MASPETVLYFAYGSNMHSRRLRLRVPSARAAGHAVLRGHELRWHKVGRDGSGKCDVTGVALGVVHGALYRIAVSEKPSLDSAEGLGAGYAEKQVDVETEGGVVRAWLYYATRVDPRLLPFTWYKALVVAGAREHSLPAAYIATLEATGVARDADLAREARNLAIIAAG